MHMDMGLTQSMLRLSRANGASECGRLTLRSCLMVSGVTLLLF